MALGGWILTGCSVQTAGRFRSIAQVGLLLAVVVWGEHLVDQAGSLRHFVG